LTSIIDKNGTTMAQNRRQGIFWILTIPQHCYVPYPDERNLQWARGQLELGQEGGYLHWQIIVAFRQKKSLRGVRELFGPYNAELTRSAAADEYCWKDDTRVEGTQFEFGSKPIQRNSQIEWDRIWDAAQKV